LVPGIKTADSAVRAGQRVFEAMGGVSRLLIKHSLLLLFLFSSAFLSAPSSLAQAPTERVLIVTGYDPGYPSVSILLRSLTATIRNGSKGRVEFFYEFQENLRIDNSKYEREMVSYLQRKYEGENINLVLALGAPSLKFLLDHEPTLLPGIPRFYYFYDEHQETVRRLWPRVTGVWASLELNKTLDIALALHPDTERVVVVSGNSVQDRFLREEAQAVFREYETRVSFTDLTDLTMDELKSNLAAVPPKTVVVFLSFFVDRKGNSYSAPGALSNFAPTANAPIYGITQTSVGAGIVGGSVLDFEALGKTTGELGLRIMAGEKPENLPAQTVPTVPMFDSRQLRRWNIDQSKLPPNAIVQFETPAFWALYKWYVIFFAAAFVIQAFLLGWLLITRARRRQAEVERGRLAEARKQSEERSRAILEAIPDLMFLLTPDGVFLDYHAKDRRDLLVPPEEFLGKNMRDVLPPTLAEALSQLFVEVQRGETQVTEYDLEINETRRWFEARLVLSGDNVLTLVRDVSSRKLTEVALSQNEAQLAGIIGSAMDGIITINEDQRIVLFNTAAEKLFLCSSAEALGQPFDDFIPERFREACRQRIRVCGEKEIERRAMGLHGDLYGLRASGEEFPIEGSISQIDLNGQTFYTVILRDITERKRAVDELRLSEQRFAKSFRANPQPMSLTIVSNGRYMDVNDSFVAMSGYTREEVIGHTSLELQIWETSEDRAKFIQQLQELGSLVNLETKFRTKSGSMRVLLLSAEKLEIAGQECLLMAASDITERVSAEKALQESEQRFRNMADSAPIMIWITGEDKGCTYLNKQWLEFTGRSLEEELGAGWAIGIHPEDHDRALEIYTRSFDERKPFGMEYRLRRKDGVYRWIFDSGAPRFSQDQVFLGYIGSCLDITMRKEAEVELRQAHEELHGLKNQLEAENVYLQEELQSDATFGEIVGHSEAVKYVLFKITQVAPTDSTVLITGETGTGKELVARAVHGASARKDRPLIKVNCGALAPTLIESELFGHEKGAFTGAGARKAGRFELANGGTIFLDEIGELPLESQVKLLRVIQENEFERLGGTKTIKVDVRIIAATNRNLKLQVESGNFREDLWYRLNVYPITVPPLRERKEDIPLLVEHFVNRYAKKSGKTITSVSPRVMQSLQSHSWPGNVRELANVIERSVIHTQGSLLHVVDRFEQALEEPPQVVRTLEEVEREYILRILEETGWRIEGPDGAARILDLNPSTLRTRMLKLGIQRRATYA
jgi:PAS domain S-box-containing protein